MESAISPENPGPGTGNRENGGGEVEEILKGEEGNRNFGGNRWPREETLSLLKIRSEMDTTFKDSGFKAPLWEEVSRKLSELGYNRNAKKCKEKFENICKYHRRTKEDRSGKTYRFSDQLEALDSNYSFLPFSSVERTNPSMAKEVNPISETKNDIQHSIPNPSSSFMDISPSTISTSSKESGGSQKKKRKLTGFFERLMNEVIEKQENLQKKFIDAIEKCEQERIVREEAWKMQELDRIKIERELLVQERSIAAAKDAAVLALQKFSEQSIPVQFSETPPPIEKAEERQENSSGGESFMHTGSSRWPKDEVESLIRLRTNIDAHYQENGPKGSLWEEISTAMKKLGYNRSAKRCKEKWENMNKYFKKVKESNKKRPEDAKTCPYFSQLDALYKEKTIKKVNDPANSVYKLKPEELLMHMMSGHEEQQQLESVTDNGENENANPNQEDGEDNDDDNEHDDYQLVATNPASVAIMG